MLRLAYLSDHICFYAVMPCVLGLAKRILFGAASEGKTITELYQTTGKAGALSDKSVRQKLVDVAKIAMRIVTWPAACVLWLYYRATRPNPGDCLYTLARRED